MCLQRHRQRMAILLKTLATVVSFCPRLPQSTQEQTPPASLFLSSQCQSANPNPITGKKTTGHPSQDTQQSFPPHWIRTPKTPQRLKHRDPSDTAAYRPLSYLLSSGTAENQQDSDKHMKLNAFHSWPSVIIDASGADGRPARRRSAIMVKELETSWCDVDHWFVFRLGGKAHVNMVD